MTGTKASEATVSLAGDVEWISECHPVGDKHEHVSVYLVRSGSGNVVVDTGSFYHRESIRTKLENATKGKGVQALLLSHSDYPHSGNVSDFRSEWGDFEIVAACSDPEIQGLPYATRCTLGESMEILGRRFSFVDPPLADRSHTMWIYDHESGTLFTADGFGSYHAPGDCELVSATVPGGIAFENIYRFHKDTFVWLRYADSDRLRAALEGLFRTYDVTQVAPVHGHPVVRTDLARYMDCLAESVRRIAEAYTVPMNA